MKIKQIVKVVLLSLGGSVGKTLITTQVLYPNMPDAKILCVDTVNTTAAEFGIENCEAHSGDEFNKTFRELMKTEGNVIVDVGGSKECDEFLTGMLAIDGSDAITHFIVPSKPNSKDQGCAVDTIERLILDGVDKSKIRVVFTDVKKNTADEFIQLIAGMKANGLEADFKLSIFHSELFGSMIADNVLISSILADTTDFQAKGRDREDGDETDYIGMMINQRMAKNTVAPNLQAVFNALF